METSDGLKIRPKEKCRWDLVSLGEVMLRLDPDESRIHTTRSFKVWEGGGEYNVARGLKRCFGFDTAIVTALADNPVGRLVQDLIYQGGVDQSHLKWVNYDGVGRAVRNGLNFTERGFGVRAALGCSDRGHTAIHNCSPATSIGNGSSKTKARAGFTRAGFLRAFGNDTAGRRGGNAGGQGVRRDRFVRFELPRISLESERRTSSRARSQSPVSALRGCNAWQRRRLTAALGFEVEGLDEHHAKLETENFRRMIEHAVREFPNFKVVATTLRNARSATNNDWGAVCYCESELYQARTRENLEIYDRVGGGDSFASGLIYGFLNGNGPQWAVECGAAHGALAMTTPGDTTMATLAEVEKVMKGGTARVAR